MLHLQAREGLALQIEAKVDWLLPRVYCPMAFFNSIDKRIKKSICQMHGGGSEFRGAWGKGGGGGKDGREFSFLTAWWMKLSFSRGTAEEVETLLCFLGQCCSVVGPGEVLCDVYTQELGAAHSLHGRTIDGQRSMQRVHSPEVNNNLLRILHIQREIVVTAPSGQAAHLAPVVCLISVADETHHSRVIRKFNEEIGVV